MLRSKFKNLKRIYTNCEISLGRQIELHNEIYKYLIKVLRLTVGGKFKVFNSDNGEWLAEIILVSKESLVIKITQLLKNAAAQNLGLTLIFAPIKNPDSSFYVQKATELGATCIVPITTKYSVVKSTNYERLSKIAIEATEQSERLQVPKICNQISLSQIPSLDIKGKIFFCNENENSNNFSIILGKHVKADDAILIGPEGGFSNDEKAMLMTYPNICSISLGNLILRAETAMIAALAIYSLSFSR